MSVHSSQQLSQGKPIADDSPLISSKIDNAKASAAQKREQILKGATQVFLQHGYAGTSMDRVAAIAGVSKQTIYTHFHDKEGLFTALIERVTTRQLQIEFGAEPFQGEPRDLLRRIAKGYLTKMDDQEFIALLRVVVAESARFPELAKLYTRTVIQPICLGLTIYFESHPELNLPDPAASAQIFFGSLSAFILSQQILYGKQSMPMDNERLVNTLVELCCQNYLER
ncbi:MAG: TetR/AcrR family transcriptional regulator [Chroococcidiopsidaceae cyanobacterium CP_BM_ER_R8_30]|nr:TetR/AcrR family transcriptional regulator [Chroococcidiopsidaceae cyanobacterium CP_BM_ER_R8_30]